MYDMTGGAQGYNQNTDQTAQSSDMFKALLQQSMQQQQAPGIGGILAKMLGAYAQGGGGAWGSGGNGGIANMTDELSGITDGAGG
jgi:hypothetical protein